MNRTASCRPRLARLVLPLVAGLVLIIATSGTAEARKGDTRSLLYVGTASFVTEDANTYGTTVGVHWGREIEDGLQWNIAGSYTATSGEKVVDNRTYELEAQTATAQSGLTWFFGDTRNSDFLPFAGAGLSVISYDIDYTFPDSTVGKTSGVGPGAFGHFGAEINIGRSFSFIPQYQASAHTITTEDGGSYTLFQAGLLLALRVSF